LRYLGRPGRFVVAVSKINVNPQLRALTPDQAVQFMRDAVAV
jgi:hypothetical protein